MQDSELLDDTEPNKDESDDYINITLTPRGSGNSVIPKDEKPINRETDGSEGSLDEGTLPGSNLSPSKKGFSILRLVMLISNRHHLSITWFCVFFWCALCVCVCVCVCVCMFV